MAKNSKNQMTRRQRDKYGPSERPNAEAKKANVNRVIEKAKSKGLIQENSNIESSEVSIPVTSKGQLVEEALDKWTNKITKKRSHRKDVKLYNKTPIDEKINELINEPIATNASESSKMLYYTQLFPTRLSRELRAEFDKTEQFRQSPIGAEMVKFLEENRANQNIKYGWEGPLYKEIIELRNRLESGELEGSDYVSVRNQLSDKIKRYLKLDVTREAISNLYESAVSRTYFMNNVRMKINPDISKEVFDSAFWNMYRATIAHMKSNYDSMNVIKELSNLTWGEMQSGFDSDFVDKFAKKLDLMASREQASLSIEKPKTRPTVIESVNRRSSFLKEQGDTPILSIEHLTTDEFQELTGLMIRTPADMFNVTTTLNPLGIETPNQFKPIIKVIKKANAKNGIPVENTVDNYVKIANMLKDKVSQDYVASVMAGVKHEPRTKNLVDTGDALIEAIAFAEQEGILRRK